MKQTIISITVVVLGGIFLASCGGGETVTVSRPENPYAYVARGCGSTENGRVYQRNLVASQQAGSVNTSETYYFRDTNGGTHYFRYTSRGSARAVSAPSQGSGGGNILGFVLGLISPIPLPPISTGSQLPQPPSLSQGSTFFVQGTDPQNNTPMLLTLRVFQQGTDMYYAADSGLTCPGTDIGPALFAFNPSNFAIPSNVLVFGLRENLRGHMDDSAAVRLDNLFFVSDSELRDLHLEYRATPWQTETFALHADSGFRRWDKTDTDAAYMKITGMQNFDAADIYAQASFGEVRSDFWKNGKLRGLAAGMFYDNLLRHDDSYHLRFEQPFAAEELAHWKFSADARFGEENRYLRFRFSRDMQNGKNSATVIYRRKF